MTDDTLQHELDRVNSMTDDQLWTRYGKMNKPEKIEAFLDALIQENRSKRLQLKIASDHNIDRHAAIVAALMEQGPNKRTVKEPWLLQSPWPVKSNGQYGKHAFGFINYNDNIIQITKLVLQKNGRYWDEEPYHVDYANGYYSLDRARSFWDARIEEGYFKTETLQ